MIEKNMKRNTLRTGIVTIALILLITQGANAATQITSCTEITSPGEYVLDQNIVNLASARCIEIRSNDVVLDGKGHNISGTPGVSGTYGVYVNGSNVTVRNLNISNWGYGVFYNNSISGKLYNNTVSFSLDHSIYFESGRGNFITNNSVVNGNLTGMLLMNTTGNIISGNQLFFNRGIGIFMESSSGNILKDNMVIENGY